MNNKILNIRNFCENDNNKHTITVFKRPTYITYPDGSKVIEGTNIKILPNGSRVTIDKYMDINNNKPKFGIRPSEHKQINSNMNSQTQQSQSYQKDPNLTKFYQESYVFYFF